MNSFAALVASNNSGNIDDFSSIRCSWQERSLPELASDEVQIEVYYSSLNYKDALAVTGSGKILRKLPLVPGIDATGIVLKSRSEKLKAGDKVLVTGCGLGENRDGGLAQIITVPASWVVSLPSSLTLESAAILGTAGFTAGLALHQLEKNDLTLQTDLPVLVTGATGGVGSLSLLMLRQKGYKTMAWSRKLQLTEQLKKWGADEVLAPPTSNARPLESAKWSAAIDNVGGEILARLLPSIKPHGSVASIGLAQSAEIHTTVFPFILRGVNILGISSGTCPRPLRELVWQNISQIKVDWSLAKTAELGRSQVFDYCQKMIRGETIGRCIVNLKKETI
ncbi:YhdH/YhfP family quinone oxidoreductase [bacterium]|nr:YhdH/YhfP family quinone oxidoreductase [bacterium]